MNPSNETLFFESIRKALAAEEDELQQLLKQNSSLYRQQNIHGIGCLYETTRVYLVWKQLMRNRFPLEIFWECPYPDQPTLHADMALLTEDRQVDSLIEYKLWKYEDAKEIRGDVEKYQRSSFQGGKYLVIFEVYGGDFDANTEYLLQSFPNVSLVNRTTIASVFYDTAKQCDVTKQIHIYMLRMK